MQANKITEEGEVIEHSLMRVESIVTPAVTGEQALKAWEAYQELKRKILMTDDFQNIQGNDFPKKSAWRKLAQFFNLTIQLVEEAEKKNDDGSIDFDVTYRAIAPNGRSAVGDGSFNTFEKGKAQSRHNVRANAHTRAFNRAVSNLIGGGEISADEMSDYEPETKQTKASAKIDTESYVIDLGPKQFITGKKLSEVDPKLLKAQLDYWKPKNPDGKPGEFVANAEAFLKSAQ